MTDESIIKRIHALMSKTMDAGCTESEAMSAAEKVQELLHKHQLSMSDIRIKEEKCTKDSYDMGMKSMQPIDWCISAIGFFTDTKCWRQRDRHDHIQYMYFGLEHDVLIAKYITKVIDRAIIFSFEEYRRTPDYANSYNKAKAKEAFQLGMASRVAARLREMKNAQRANDQASTGRDLVVVKNAVVTEEFAKSGIALNPSKKYRGKNITDGRAYHAGVDAGNRVNINPGVTEKTYAKLS